MLMWLHVTAFSTFPFLFRRTGEGNFYRQHHQHRRFFYHGKHYFNSTATGKGGSFLSSSVLLDPTSRDTLDVLFLLFIAFFWLCFFSLFSFSLLLFRSAFSLACFFFATINKTQITPNKDRNISHTQKLQRRQYAGFMLFLPSNQSFTFSCVFLTMCVMCDELNSTPSYLVDILSYRCIGCFHSSP
jgi:hypothetical protein